ncbi:MAG: hypothetical protein ACLP6E_14960 [Acidimicrobiales bacterium]
MKLHVRKSNASAASILRRIFRCRPNDQSGQALVLVLGLVAMIFLGAIALAQNVSQHYPIVEQDLIDHEAYRAMQAGINQYLSLANSDPDAVACDGSLDTVSNWPSPTSSTSTTLSIPNGVCSGFSTNTWEAVPNLATTQGPPAYFMYGTPIVYVCTGGTTVCPANVWVSLKVIGASKSGQFSNYVPGTVTFDPANGFLLNLYWLNYDQEDPTVVPTSPTCTWYWSPSPAGLGSKCVPVDYVAEETLNGNIFSNDPLFICANSSTASAADSPTINGTISSADPSYATLADPDNSCDDSIYGSETQQDDQPFEPIPTDDVVLGTEAADNGCEYEGPTEISLAKNGAGAATTVALLSNGKVLSALGGTLNVAATTSFTASGQISVVASGGTAVLDYTGVTSSTFTGVTIVSGTPSWTLSTGKAVDQSAYEMDVTSPETQTGGTGNDALSDVGNTNTCMAGTGGGWVPYPANGVVFVENCPSTDSLCGTYNPLGSSADVFAPDDQKSGYEGPSASSTSTSSTEGDAIIQGTVSGPLTIAAQNNVVITGNLCYASWTANASLPSQDSSCGDTPPSTPTTEDVLGLIAYNYVVVNHPMTEKSGQWDNNTPCTNNLAPIGSGTTPNCDLDDPVIDAAILALNQQFFVANWDDGAFLDSINVNGTISEDWRGPVGVGGSGGNGYLKNYNYDQRLEWLSPPDYLNPGTSAWTLGTISAVTGTCPSAVTGCTTPAP